MCKLDSIVLGVCVHSLIDIDSSIDSFPLKLFALFILSFTFISSYQLLLTKIVFYILKFFL